MQLDTRSKYMIKPKTMVIPIESFDVQVESPVDFAYLKRNRMNLDALMEAQRLVDYFRMLNGPTYVNLVKDFWVRLKSTIQRRQYWKRHGLWQGIQA